MPRILLAEDDDSLRGFLARALERAGYEVTACADGDEAAAVIDEDWDLLLTDIVMPGLDGIELCRKLRADDRTRSIPVLAITGYDDRHYPDRVRTAGADQVLMKPCDWDVLVNEARRLLSR